MKITMEEVNVRRFFSTNLCTFSEVLDNHEVFLC